MPNSSKAATCISLVGNRISAVCLQSHLYQNCSPLVGNEEDTEKSIFTRSGIPITLASIVTYLLSKYLA